ncbi:TVP38/TMEM64 family protein [Clostridium sp.]|nr:TVP38/TMEM64 family protein [Clostridium sp.]MCI1798714.1 TVP38/TMEM64 family protein [Clostridium sp.]MCI1869524.1 TVP38/TMEM64 family protein [Clostridium sp.]
MNDKIKSIINYVLFGIFVIALAFVIVKYGKYLRHIRIHSFIRYIKSYGSLSALIFIIIYVFKPVLFIVPSSVMSIIAGSIYGPYIATILSMIGCFGSATVAFSLAKFFGRSFVDKILRGKAMDLDKNIEKYGFRIMTVMRLSFVFPFDGLSYAAGLSKMKYKDFIFGTLVGILPEMITYSFMGTNIIKPFSVKFFIPILFLAAVVIITITLKKRTKNIQ